MAARAFAHRLHDDPGVERVHLFGSQASGRAGPERDYDLIIVSPTFETVPRRRRGVGIRDLFSEVGGDAALDLICLTPEEFERAKTRATLVRQVLPEAIDLLAEAQ
jgi:predicted nucleotidyltransferase